MPHPSVSSKIAISAATTHTAATPSETLSSRESIQEESDSAFPQRVESGELNIRQSKAKILLAMAICLAVGLIALPWDFRISLAIRYGGIRGDWQKFVNLSEVFAHFLSLTLLFSLLLWCDVKRRKMLASGIAFVALSGLAANAAKMIIPKARPNSLDHLTPEDYPNSAWDLWGTPFTGSWFSEEIRSFPSGHAATATAVAIALTFVYPRGRWFFAFLALLASFQRLQVGAHYVSDVMGGIAITLLLAYLYLPYFARNCDNSTVLK